jgi:hypothetical protein
MHNAKRDIAYKIPTKHVRNYGVRQTKRKHSDLLLTYVRNALYYKSHMFIKNGGDTMPRGDRTGPEGMGPMTGRRSGFCAGYSVPGNTNPAAFGCGYGRGRNFRRGGGRGGYRGSQYYNDSVMQDMPEKGFDEEKALKSQSEYLEEQLAKVNKRLKEMDEKPK